MWVSVGEVGQIYEAELIALRLREAGIEARVLEKSFQQIPLPQVRSFEKTQVMVPAARGEEARRILTESSNLPEDGESESEA